MVSSTPHNSSVPRASASLVRRLLAAASTNLTATVAAARLQLAAKAAIAAGIAFLIAPLMPGVAAEYPYYAPLGALVAMYHNVAGSLRQGIQALVGLALGILLATLLSNVTDPSPLAVAAVMGLGVLLAGIPGLGSSQDWVPTAALLVLLVGGSDPDGFSFGYLVQMAVGVVVGVAVNMLIFPPLRFNAALKSLAKLRLALSQQLSDMGTALAEEWPPEHEEWSRRSDELADATRTVRHLMKEAEESKRANLRSKFHPRNLNRDYEVARDLERLTFYLQDMTEVLSDLIWSDEGTVLQQPPDWRNLSEALRSTSRLLAATPGENSDSAQELFDTARDSLHRIGHDKAADGGVGVTDSLRLSLYRILRVLDPTRSTAGPKPSR
ncbi:FUSC family protein [Pseudarthrobacter sp. PS3-L1]|uniref:FUSC family protein n=1 Tax=Pseudarthrobacter sp. PS3-L1 TaxID=3046207 RepID=UPI0024B8A060|nr:FUSC family protein [Pseudarthrobacter sp. PS3-L1]MDJ0320173.1 FUSC family protein [Pseudarthrobacter sp. PS3-L1]